MLSGKGDVYKRQEYWGLCAQNDWRLMKPYLDTYFKMIPFAEKLAKEYGAEHEDVYQRQD